ncbi:probable chitinase 2 [Nasonia vitripennis]|uniref:GH18 domain-containing protein n=1 Tax=Nasonia vitripennis TaxID=7425 RepID=A0A7M7H5J4_NASVI|nr:probable chitinase 2 [Nasonia vitripennis]
MKRIIALLLLIVAAFASASVSYSNAGLKKPNHEKYVACYFQSWAIYRNDQGVFQISDINTEHCTHIIYAFAGLNASSWEIQSLDHFADLADHNGKDGYREFTKLRYHYQHIKPILAIGGWNQGSRNYSEMANDAGRRTIFVRSVVSFLRAHNFHGLDIDWEYPGTRGGSEHDRANFVRLLKELYYAFKPHKFLLTAAISAHLDEDSLERRYSLKPMAEYLDYIHVMTYDYHVGNRVVMPNAPLDKVNMTIQILKNTAVPMSKFILGLPTYGRGFILEEPLRSELENPIGKPSRQQSWMGPYLAQEGFFAYNEICKYLLSEETWKHRWDNMSYTPYAIYDNRVIVYDDSRSLHAKIHLAMQNGFGGVFVWSIDEDDFRGECIPKHKRDRVNVLDYQYPLMKAINDALEHDSSASSSFTSSASAFVLLLLLCFNSLRYSL